MLRGGMQVIRNSCGLAILDDYHDLGKYNIKTLCSDEAADEKKSEQEKPKDTKAAVGQAGSQRSEQRADATSKEAGAQPRGEDGAQPSTAAADCQQPDGANKT
jgi:hypothetical protein